MFCRILPFAIFAICASCSLKATQDSEGEPCKTAGISINSNLKNIYRPCRQFIYQAKYYDSDRQLISDELVLVYVPGKDWEIQPDKQDEILILYDFDQGETDWIEKHNINKSRPIHWTLQETTGVIETVNEVWIHPFRQNQYGFTEVASFPNVKFPLEPGKVWVSSLNIFEGWGDWENSNINTRYEIMELQLIKLPFRSMNAWHVLGTSIADFGQSTHNFWFNEEYGFVKMEIENYEGQTLHIELIKVKG